MNRTEVITLTDGPPTGELAPGVELRALATGALGAKGLTTALATFHPSAELPYHRHTFSEVIVVLSGEAIDTGAATRVLDCLRKLAPACSPTSTSDSRRSEVQTEVIESNLGPKKT